MMHYKKIISILIALFLFCSIFALAEYEQRQATTGSIKITIRDMTANNEIRDAKVSVYNSIGEFIGSQTTAGGAAVFGDLNPGKYAYSVSIPNYKEGKGEFNAVLGDNRYSTMFIDKEGNVKVSDEYPNAQPATVVTASGGGGGVPTTSTAVAVSDPTLVGNYDNFRNAYWQCHDGYEEKSGYESSCKPSAVWQKYAEESCFKRCNKEGKCGVNSFQVMNSCSSGPSVSVTKPMPTETTSVSVSGPILVENPVCSHIGTSDEGWYVKDELLVKEECACKAVCKDDGFYSSCTGSLIKYSSCANIVKPYIGEVKTTPVETKIDGAMPVAVQSFSAEDAKTKAVEAGLTEVKNVKISNEGERKIYEVEGVKKSTWLFFIPVSKTETVRIDAATNEVLEKPLIEENKKTIVENYLQKE